MRRLDRAKPRVLAGAATIVVFVVYFVTHRRSNAFNQYVLLADAFLHRRLYLVDAPPWLELTRVGRRGYVLDPPAPAALLMPFVAAWGTKFRQVYLTLVLGPLAVGAYTLAAARKWGPRTAITTATLVGLGTNLWWVSTDGGLWSVAHTCAVFFCAVAFLESTGRRRPWLVGALLGLAGLSRLPTFLLFPLYAQPLVKGRARRPALKILAVFALALGGAASIYLAYNCARFGNPLDGGWSTSEYLSEPWFARGRFHPSYVWRHVYAILFESPRFSDEVPFLLPDNAGVALLLTTPAFLYALRAPMNEENAGVIAALVLASTPLLLHGLTGGAQFGYRYALDLLPALLVLTVSGIRAANAKRVLLVIGAGCVANLWGALAFNLFDWAS